VALALAGSVPLLWGTSPVAAVAATRFAAQLADNAKYPAVPMPAFDAGHGQLPALDGVFGLRHGGDADGLEDFFRDRVEDPVESPKLRLVLLRDVVEQPLIAARATATLDIMGERGLPVTVIDAEGTSPLERLAGLVAFGDYVSAYLALLLGLDPTPVPFASDLADRILVT
jgi:glucose/mannose-6-phosphate isomerase